MSRNTVVGRALQIVVGLTVVVLAARTLIANWSDLRSQNVNLHVRPLLLIASLALVVAVFGLLIEAWRRVIIGYGERLTFLAAARIWILASLGKYVPGKVWAVVGAAVLAQRAGVAGGVAVAGALVLQALALGSGVVLVSATGVSAVVEILGRGAAMGMVLIGVIAAAAIASLMWRPAIELLRRTLPGRMEDLRPVGVGTLVGALGANIVAWVGYGAAFLLLTRGLSPGAQLSLQQSVAAFSSAYIVGFVVALAPAGVGAREGVLVLLLAAPLGAKLAAAAAVAARILWTVAELGVAAPFLLGVGTVPASATLPDPSEREER